MTPATSGEPSGDVNMGDGSGGHGHGLGMHGMMREEGRIALAVITIGEDPVGENAVVCSLAETVTETP